MSAIPGTGRTSLRDTSRKLKTAVGIGAAASGSRFEWVESLHYALECERLGVDYCWSAEGWGQDCIAPLAFVAARTTRLRLGTGIMQISARVPSMAAMTALTMATLSQDRFVLGLGVSGPQVVEGLQGVPFAFPIERLIEYLDILEMAFRGEPLRYGGRHYRLPLRSDQTKVLRLAQKAETKIPIYLATLATKGLELTGARADGWVGTCFIPESASIFLEPMRRGATAAGRTVEDLDLQVGGTVRFGDDLERILYDTKMEIAFQIGGMGSANKNFYSQAYERAGYEEQSRKVQSLWMDGRREDATAAVPDDMARLGAFIGTDEMVLERVLAFARAGVTTLKVRPHGPSAGERLATMEHFLDIVRQANHELATTPGPLQSPVA